MNETNQSAPAMPQRVIEGGTDIVLRFGDVATTARLNDTETARAFAAKLPATIRVSGTGLDFCGRMPFKLPYEEGQVHNGWLDGDIDYNPGGGWFALLYGGGDDSAGYGDQVTMGALTCPLDTVSRLSGTYDLAIELAE